MPLKVTRVSVAQIAADGVALRPAEAALIVWRMWDLAMVDGQERGAIPTLHELKLDCHGRLSRTSNGCDAGPTPTGVSVAPAETAGGLRALGSALHLLLSSAGNSPSACGAGHLWIAADLAVGHPLGRPDLAVSAAGFKPFDSVEEFLNAIEPSAADRDDAVLVNLFSRWQTKTAASATILAAPVDVPSSAALSIADLSPLRRKSSQTLEAISDSTKIPVRRLEALERGDFSGWPAGLIGRAYIRSYAVEAGIDPDVLLALVEAELPPAESIEQIKSVRIGKRIGGAAVLNAVAVWSRWLARTLKSLPASFARSSRSEGLSLGIGYRSGQAQGKVDMDTGAPSTATVAAVGTIAGVAALGAVLIVMVLWRIAER